MLSLGEQFDGSRPAVVVVLPAEEPVHWLEIELIGEDGSPVPFEEYLVILPDGKNAKGYTDFRGVGRFERLENRYMQDPLPQP